jgi:hypothetical protein
MAFIICGARKHGDDSTPKEHSSFHTTRVETLDDGHIVA